jgi:hypothetical protein
LKSVHPIADPNNDDLGKTIEHGSFEISLPHSGDVRYSFMRTAEIGDG